MSSNLTEIFSEGLNAVDRYMALEALAVIGTGLLTARVTYSFYYFDKHKNVPQRDFFHDHRYIMWLPLIPSYLFATGTGLHLAMSHHKTSAMLLGRATRLAAFCTIACAIGWITQIGISLYQDSKLKSK